jgi:hypothetical protein
MSQQCEISSHIYFLPLINFNPTQKKFWGRGGEFLHHYKKTSKNVGNSLYLKKKPQLFKDFFKKKIYQTLIEF